MTTDIRAIREGELEAAHYVVAYSFMGDRSAEGRERMRHIESIGTPFALYEDGAMAALVRIYPLRMFVHGASVPLGGVASVACLPEHRRKGYVGQLLRHALAVMRDEGQPISALYTPHPALYRRYGWMIASSALLYKFNPKEIALADGGRPAGHASRITEEQWPTLDGVYREFAEPRNGYLDRDERWWKEALFRRLYDNKRQLNDVAVWADDDGRPRGYVVYHSSSEPHPGPDSPSIDRVYAKELIALDRDAYAGLLRYLLGHDLAASITWFGRTDEPLTLIVDEPDRIKREHGYGFMLRIIDVEKAIAVRPPAGTAPEGAFTINIADAAAPWNQGVWRIECSEGRLAATKADGTADISTDAAAFAAMFNGYLRPSEAARAGLAEVSDAKAASLAERILAADYRPHPSDFF